MKWPKLQRYVGMREVGWIIALSGVALLFAYGIVNLSIDHYKRFNQADRLATGRVIESDAGDEDNGPWSNYEFKVGKEVYDGSTNHELPEGKKIRVRYNSADPNSNHAEYESGFIGAIFVMGILLCGVVAVLVVFIRKEVLELH